MSAAESACKAKYLSMTLDQLKRQCSDAWLATSGTKSELVARLVDYEKPAGGWGGAAPAPAPADRGARGQAAVGAQQRRAGRQWDAVVRGVANALTAALILHTAELHRAYHESQLASLSALKHDVVAVRRQRPLLPSLAERL